MKHNELIKQKDSSLAKDVVHPTDNKPGSELKHFYNIGSIRQAVRSVNVTPDNRNLIVTNANNPGIRIIDLELLEYKSQTFSKHLASVRLTSISADGTTLYTASWDGNIHRYHIESGNCINIYCNDGLPMPSCYISRDGRYLFSAHYESVKGFESINRGRCRDLTNNKIYEYFHQNRKTLPGCMDIAFDGEFVYTAGDDGICQKFSLFEQTSIIKYCELAAGIRKIFVSKRFIATASTDGIIRIFYKRSGRKYKELIHNPSKEVLDVRITQDEARLVSVSEDGTIMCADLKAGKILYKKKIHSDWIWSMCLFNNDQQIVTGSRDGSIIIMKIDGSIQARLFNLSTNDFLIDCPNDKKEDIYPKAYIYTTNEKLIKVFRKNKHTLKREILENNDSSRQEYIHKLNRKNIIIAKLRTDKSYQTLSENFIRHRKLLEKMGDQRMIKLLQE